MQFSTRVGAVQVIRCLPLSRRYQQTYIACAPKARMARLSDIDLPAMSCDLLLEASRFRLDVSHTRVVATSAGLAMRRALGTFLFLVHRRFAFPRRYLRSWWSASSR